MRYKIIIAVIYFLVFVGGLLIGRIIGDFATRVNSSEDYTPNKEVMVRVFTQGFEWGDGKANATARMLDCPGLTAGKPLPAGPLKCMYYRTYNPPVPLVCNRFGNPPCFYAGDRPLKELGFSGVPGAI